MPQGHYCQNVSCIGSASRNHERAEQIIRGLTGPLTVLLIPDQPAEVTLSVLISAVRQPRERSPLAFHFSWSLLIYGASPSLPFTAKRPQSLPKN
jgi:hypothetical protein